MVNYDAIMSQYKEEMYAHYFTCAHCNNDFISSDFPLYCPSCGNRLNMIKQGNIIISNWNGGDSNIQDNTNNGS